MGENEWADLIGKEVVLDSDSNFVYIGKLESADGGLFKLADADVHDMNDTNTTREVYLIEARKFGVRANRKRAIVSTARIVSVSLLEDVIEY